jgi:hypothetical protein
MTATPIIDPERFLHEQLAKASPDLLREVLEAFINALLLAQATCVAPSSGRVASSARTGATATGTATSTPGWARWMSRCPRCARAPSSRTGY